MYDFFTYECDKRLLEASLPAWQIQHTFQNKNKDIGEQEMGS
jgi:hypothetical protein